MFYDCSAQAGKASVASLRSACPAKVAVRFFGLFRSIFRSNFQSLLSKAQQRRSQLASRSLKQQSHPCKTFAQVSSQEFARFDHSFASQGGPDEAVCFASIVETSCLAMLGNAWQCLAMLGNAWQCLAGTGCSGSRGCTERASKFEVGSRSQVAKIMQPLKEKLQTEQTTRPP